MAYASMVGLGWNQGRVTKELKSSHRTTSPKMTREGSSQIKDRES